MAPPPGSCAVGLFRIRWMVGEFYSRPRILTEQRFFSSARQRASNHVFLKFCFAFLKHGSLWTYRVATYAVLIAGLTFLVLVFGLRYLVLPNINDYREPIAQTIMHSVGQRVTIGSIQASWQGYRPDLRLPDVEVFGTDEI